MSRSDPAAPEPHPDGLLAGPGGRRLPESVEKGRLLAS
jgi:hypothetical protein